MAAIAARRRCEPATLRWRVRGDLDWIVMTCLEQDRERRYETAAALAEDLTRYLESKPVQARPPSVPYVLGKYLRRYRLPVAVAGTVAATLLCAAIAVWALGVFRQPAPPAPQTRPSAARQHWTGWEALFDGTSTAAFHGYGQTAFPTDRWWITSSGALRALGGDSASYIITAAEYDDFELAWEWAIEPNGNSGVIYRATEYYDEPWKSGPEYQLLDDDEPDNPLAFQKSGAAYRLIAPTNKVLKPLGQWNHSRLLVQGNHVEHWLNERRVVEYEIDSAEFNAAVAVSPFRAYLNFAHTRKGGIAFQNWTSELWLRNIKVRRLVSE